MEAVIFGKLPAHGDFVSSGLTQSAEDLLDFWLSHSLEAARRQLGDEFLEVHHRAGPLRCIIPSGVLAREKLTGAVACSIDRSGRTYPVFASVATALDSSVFAQAELVETALRLAIVDGLSFEQLLALLKGFGRGASPLVEFGLKYPEHTGLLWRVGIQDGLKAKAVPWPPAADWLSSLWSWSHSP